MIVGKVSRAHYSTGITQDFLQNILARAQEATAKKATTAKPRRFNERKATQNSSKPRRRNAQQNVAGTVTARVKPTFNHSIVDRQPQFKRKGAANIKASAAEEDLVSALDSTGTTVKKQSKPVSSFTRRKTSGKREVAGLAKKAGSTTNASVLPPVKLNRTQEGYVPQEPTLSSLLKFYPGLPNTPTSRLINYSLELMKTADYPLYRRANYGFVENVQEAPKSMSYTLKTPCFGQYTRSVPLTFEKEKLFKNLTVEADAKKFDSAVLGNYHDLKPLQKSDFKTVAKKDDKREELAANSNIVRQSLQSINIDTDKKQLVYQVCSGLKPISELTQ